MSKKHETGMYESIYGNAVEYEEGNDYGWDVDMQEEIPFEAIDFDIPLGEIE